MLRRSVSVLSSKSFEYAAVTKKRRIKSWQLHEYGGIDELQLGSIRLPVIRDPNEVLVQVNAASVNPIDLLMIGGYGRNLFQIQRNFENELPLTVGRDFAGTIIAKGHKVRDGMKVGDEVYGFIPLHKQGTFSEVILANACHVLPIPKQLSSIESTSLVYATMTAWSALFIFGNLVSKQTDGLRVLILGCSGGVGTAAVQLLKSQDCVVFGTCSSDAVSLVYNLGADCVFDYTSPDFHKNVELEGRYHIILDAAQIGYQNIPKSWKYDTYITLNSPLLKSTDSYGLMAGLAYSASDLLDANLRAYKDSSCVKWGFFIPSTRGFEFVDDLISKEKIKPVIHKTFGFGKLQDAFKTVSEGHLRGKVVIDFSIDNDCNE
ncbi:NAD(P)H oxidoreductase RTN4IP1, mitochondrial [Leptinotarsa decemlineata]|uniref:NAD(P)H oxidoreductase RTN4IP1, mitochondrial n=1 Tax=Leptinotarsa decemlineata TaxID=7539 RepID=UPI003D30C83F